MTIKFTPIKPGPLNVDKMLNALRNMVKKQAGFSNTQFGLTYKTWEHEPKFIEEFKETIKEMVGSALTSGEGSKENPYPFITKGTSVRFATMTPDFSPKSTKRTIGSGGGRGGVAYIDTRRPRPGIEAREFEEEIKKREQPKFEKRGQAAMDKAAAQSGHKI